MQRSIKDPNWFICKKSNRILLFKMFHNITSYNLGSIYIFMEKKVSCATWNIVFKVLYEHNYWTVIVFSVQVKTPALIFTLEKWVSGFVQRMS